MNYHDKIQKFSIRKYTVGTFSTVIATLVFLGFNTSQAHAAETNQPASVVKQKQQSNKVIMNRLRIENLKYKILKIHKMVNHYLLLMKMSNQILVKLI